MTRALPFLVAIFAVALVLLALWMPAATGAGWRAGFLLAGSAPIGATALLLIGRLTGGKWQAPLRPIALPLPMLLIGAVPLIFAQSFIVAPPHLATWLSPLWFGFRTLGALAIWSFLAWRIVVGSLGQLVAALGLAAHGALVSLMAVDWILAVAPGQPSSAMGMALAAQQIVAATAFACLLGAGTERMLDDLARLMIAGCLGVSYLLYMDWLIVWYGNLPPRTGWYLLRMTGGWDFLPALALIFGLVAPIVALALRQRRLAGACALAGLLLADLWLVGPRGGAVTVLAALLCCGLLCAAMALAVSRFGGRIAHDAA